MIFSFRTYAGFSHIRLKAMSKISFLFFAFNDLKLYNNALCQGSA